MIAPRYGPTGSPLPGKCGRERIVLAKLRSLCLQKL